MRSILPRFAIASILLLASWDAWGQIPERPAAASNGWLNVVELGASGSEFTTTAQTKAGSAQITVKDPGDFRVGQGVMVSRCNIHFTGKDLWGPEEPYSHHGPLGDAIEIRGYDGACGSWIGYVLDIDGEGPLTFRWSDDLTRTWKGKKTPVTYDWQPLSQNIEVKFNRRDLKPGNFVTFSARDQLVSTIEKIEGSVLTLKHPANRTAADAVVRHCDGAAIQATIDRAIREHKNVFLPAGRYRLAAGLSVRKASGIAIEGASGVDTVLDITEGAGSCLGLHQGTEVTVRNLRMIGHTPMAEAAGSFKGGTGHWFWPCALRPCGAMGIHGTERVFVENVHASRMSTECFISGGPFREGAKEPAEYTKSATFLRCSVTDCAANAFNNCDFAENTNILYCRIDGAGWHAYEGSGRFIRLIGNYVRNAGPFTIGDIPVNFTRAQLAHFEKLGVGQAVVADNVFEGIGRCGGVTICHGPTQVIVANNLFINYNGTAINASASTVFWSFPPQNISITGNIIDLTCQGQRNYWGATGIVVSTSDTTVSNNQVYVRGACDPKTTGIRLVDGAQNVLVHDNLIRNCGSGLVALRLEGKVVKVADSRRFTVEGVPYPWQYSGFYKGWQLVWLGDGKSKTPLAADVFDNDTLEFRLAEPCEGVQAGDKFVLTPPLANWQVRSNTIDGCRSPVVLDALGSATSIFKDNLISRGAATGVGQAVSLRGRFTLSGNHVIGFDEPGSAALLLGPDAIGRVARNRIERNTFERCETVVKESRAGVWKESLADDNLFIDCKTSPGAGGTVVARESK